MADDRPARLTGAQRKVLRLWSTRRSAKEIGRELGITHCAVNERLRSARRILGVGTSAEAARLLAAAEHSGDARTRHSLAYGAARDCDRRLLTELLLPFGQKAAEACAERLLGRFGTLGRVLAATPGQRKAASGAAEPAARHLEAVRRAMLEVLRDEALPGACVSGTRDLARYLRADMGLRPNEQLRVLFLAADKRVLADEIMVEGSIDNAPLLARPIVHLALDLGASGLILVHNHPSGSPKPSAADINATRLLVSVCNGVDIVVHDHLIVAGGGWTSFRLEGLM